MALDETTAQASGRTHILSNLPAACCSLGYTRKGKYHLGEYCKEAVRELIRYLRRDDANHTARRYLGKAKVLSLDLLPIVMNYHRDEELFDLVLRLLVNLTNPVLLLYREELPTDVTSRRCYLQIISQLQVYKEAFTDYCVWAIFVTKLTSILKTDSSERSEETGMVAERILVLIRNILQVPADPAAEMRPDCDASVHDQVLWALHESGMIDIVLYLSSAESEQAYCMHILEIICLMLRDQSGSELAQSQAERSLVEQAQDAEQLMNSRQQEKVTKYNRVKSSLNTRHPKFGGSFVLKNVKGIGDNDLIVYKPYTDAEKIPHGVKKAKSKRRKNELPQRDNGEKRRSPYGVRLFLQKFCNEFLSASYNALMRYVKGCLMRRIAQPNDESFYLWALKFFMEFNRVAKSEIKLVSETMNVTTFYWVMTQMEHSHSMIKTDKKKLLFWSRRTHLALRGYQELLLTLTAMECSPESAVRQSAQVIQGNLFYVVEHREALLWLLNTFEESKMSRSYMQDLIQALHVFTKLLERFCKKQRGLVVQTKSVKRKKKAKKSAPAAPKPVEKVVSNEELWEEVAPQLSVVLSNGTIPEDIVPFDAASDRDIDDQKVDAMRKIHTMLKHHQYEEAVGLLRASREVWVDNDIFGKPNAAPEEDLMTLREVFFADIAQDPEVAVAAERETGHENGGEEEENEYEDDEEDEEGVPSYNEKEFDFDSFLKRLVCSKAIRPACKLLSTFETNSTFVNHCVAKLLHRVSFEAKTPGVLFQASLFIQFRKILASKRPEHQELANLALYIFGKFAEVAEKNNLAFVELLFWKSAKEAIDIESGYEGYKEPSAASKKVWREEEEDELRRLHSEYSRDEPNEDMLDWILQRLINRNRTKAGVRKKLRELFLELPTGKNARLPKDWSEAEVSELTQLFQEYKDSNDPMEHLLSGLTVKRGKKKIIDKLLELGLISDRKEVHKKSRSKSSARRGHDTSSSSESDSDSGGKRGHKKAARKKAEARDRAAIKKAHQRTGSAPTGQIIASLREVMEADLREGVQWLLESLSDTAVDLEEDGTGNSEEGVPLLPVEDAAVAAMDNPLFHRLLQNLGMSPPFDEQEVYWRIPENFTAAQIREKMSLLQAALDGALPQDLGDIETHTVEEGEEHLNDSDLSSDASSKQRGRKSPKEHLVRHSSSEEESAMDEPSDRTEQAAKPKKSTKKRSAPKDISVSDSDSESGTPARRKKKEKTKKRTPSNKKRSASKSLVDSSSESETEQFPATKDQHDNGDDTSSTIKQLLKKSVVDADSQGGLDALLRQHKTGSKKKGGRVKRMLSDSEDDETTRASAEERDENDINSGNTTVSSFRTKSALLESESEDEPVQIQQKRRVLSDSDDDKQESHQRRRVALSSDDSSDKEDVAERASEKRSRRVLSSSDEDAGTSKKRAVEI